MNDKEKSLEDLLTLREYFAVLVRELNAANARIKRLEEGGDNAVLILHYPDRLAVWNKAKGADI